MSKDMILDIVISACIPTAWEVGLVDLKHRTFLQFKYSAVFIRSDFFIESSLLTWCLAVLYGTVNICETNTWKGCYQSCL